MSCVIAGGSGDDFCDEIMCEKSRSESFESHHISAPMLAVQGQMDGLWKGVGGPWRLVRAVR